MSDGANHWSSGMGDDTVVYCPHADALLDGDEKTLLGPGGNTRRLAHCFYCGEDARDNEHRIDRENSETHCENTSQSTVRFCPHCGERVDQEANQAIAFDGGDR